jgi:hypothetical protein
MTAADRFLLRLDAVEARLSTHVARDFPQGALTAPDPPTGERWEVGQVWAHLAEFIPYWLGEATHVIEHGGSGAVPFGRTKSDPGRIGAIERDRRGDRAALWNRIAASVGSLRAFLTGLEDSAWKAEGQHATLGVMDLGKIIDEFLVGHLEQHADQLDGLTV